MYICMRVCRHVCIFAYMIVCMYACIALDGYCSTVQGLLDWFEVDLGFTELLFIQIDLCVLCVFVLYSPIYAYMIVCMYACMPLYVCMYVCMPICMYVRMHSLYMHAMHARTYILMRNIYT